MGNSQETKDMGSYASLTAKLINEFMAEAWYISVHFKVHMKCEGLFYFYSLKSLATEN